MAMSGGTPVDLKTINFPNSSGKQKIYLKGYYKYSQDASYTYIKAGMYIYTSSSGWSLGPWGNYSSDNKGHYLKSGSTEYYSTAKVPSTNSTAHWIFEDKEFKVSNTTTSATISWRLAANPSSWLGDSSWNKPTGSWSISLPVVYKITYYANGGSGAPSATPKYSGQTAYITSEEPVRSGYTFAGWNTAANGSGTSYSSSAAYSTHANLSLYAQWSQNVGKCGAPSSLSVTDNGNNTIKFSCKVGDNGTSNTANGVQLFATFDGSTPNFSAYEAYQSVIHLVGSAGTTVSGNLDLNAWSEGAVSKYFGTDFVGPVKFIARTVGSAGGLYYSDCTTTVGSGNVTWHLPPNPVTMWRQPSTFEAYPVIGQGSSYTLIWDAPDARSNNAVGSYEIKVIDLMNDEIVHTATSSTVSYTIPSTVFEANHEYVADVYHLGASCGKSKASRSRKIVVQSINQFDSFDLDITNAGTIPAFSSASVDQPTFLNCGAGDICKISWSPAVAEGNKLDSYSLVICDSNSGETLVVNTGATEYCLTAETLLKHFEVEEGLFECDVSACSAYGYNYSASSNPLTFKIIKSAALYTTVTDQFANPVVKRAIPYVKDVKSGEWKLVVNAFAKNDAGNWDTNDAQYEALFTDTGETVIDATNDTVYTY